MYNDLNGQGSKPTSSYGQKDVPIKRDRNH